MCILNNYDYEAHNFIENLSFYIASESSSKLLFKVKDLSSRKEDNQTQSTKYEAKKAWKGEDKKVYKHGKKMKGN